MGLRLMCAAGACLVALLLLLAAALLRLLALLVQLLTLRYTLALTGAALTLWFVDSRRRRYAKGFYSCSRVPLTPEEVARRESVRREQEAKDLEDDELQQREQCVRRRQRSRADERSSPRASDEGLLAAGAATTPISEEGEDASERESVEDVAPVAPVELPAPAVLPVKVKELEPDDVVASPSETESEDDDSEANAATASASASAPSVFRPQSLSKHRYSLEGGRRRSNTGELQHRQATRPRSSSTVSNWMQARRPIRTSRNSGASALASSPSLEGKLRVSSSARRRDTFTSRKEAMASSPERRRRLSSSARGRLSSSARGRDTSSFKQEAFASGRSSSGSLEDALRSDGYWIGDFRVQRRLVPRRGYGSSPKAN